MFWNNNLFKTIRKKSPLLISDLRVLLGQKCWSGLSRVEAGKQKPTLEIVILYHIIFDAPLESLLEQDIYQLKKVLVARAQEQVDALRSQPSDVEIFDRITYLERVYEKCTN